MTTQRDSVPEGLKLWRAVPIPIDEGRRESCRTGAIQAIERALVRSQRARVKNRWLKGILLAAMIGASGVAGLLVMGERAHEPEMAVGVPDRTEARARMELGTAEVVRAQNRYQLSHLLSMPLRAEDVVQVGTRSLLVVDLPDAGSAEWQAGTELTVHQVDARHQRFELRSGAVAVSIPPDSPRRDLVVTTPNVDVVVAGTVFDVSVSREEAEAITEVNVQRGMVRLVRHGRTIARLNAGDSWSSHPVKPIAEEEEEELTPKPQTRTGTPPKSSPNSREKASTLKEENALYRAAMDARNGGYDERTVALLDQLLAQYPRSPLAQDAKVERFRALGRLGRKDEASQAARHYLAEHDDGYARDEARQAALPAKKAAGK